MARSIEVAGIHISITGNSADFRSAAKAARAEIFKLKAEMAKLKAAGRTALVGFAAAAGGASLLGKSLADGIDNLGKLSTSLRTSVKDLQALEQAAGLQGVAWKQVEKGLINLRNVLGEISSGVAYKTQTDAWAELGLRIEDVINLNAADQVRAIGKAIKESVPPAEQLSVAAELVGKKAALGFLRMSGEVSTAQARLEEFGLALSQGSVRDTEAANDALFLLGNAFLNVGRQITADAAPGIKAWADGVMLSLKPGGDLRDLLESLAHAFSRVAGVVGEFISLAGPFVNGGTLMAGAIYLVSTRALTLTAQMWATAKSVGALIAAARAGTVTLGVGGLAGAVGLLGTALGGALGLAAVVGLGVSAFREFNSETATATGLTNDLTAAIGGLTVAKLKTQAVDLKAQIETAKGAARLRELGNAAGVMGMGHAVEAQKREVADLENRLAKTIDLIRQTSKEAPGVPSAGPLALTITPEAGGDGPVEKGEAALYGHIGRPVAGVVQATKAMEEAAEATKHAWADVGSSIKSSIGGTLDGIVDGMNDLGDVADGVLKTLAKIFLKSALLGPLGAGGLALPGFAAGGIHRGGARIVGENGPELEITGPSRIYSPRDTRRILGGAGTVNVNVNVMATDSSALRNALDREFQRVTPQIVEMSTSRMVNQLSRPSAETAAVRNA